MKITPETGSRFEVELPDNYHTSNYGIVLVDANGHPFVTVYVDYDEHRVPATQVTVRTHNPLAANGAPLAARSRCSVVVEGA